MWAITIEQQKGLNMNIKYITCSDPRNHNSYDELFDLCHMDPRVEIAVQMHPDKVSPDTERYKWIKQLVDMMSGDTTIKNVCNLAIHVNNDWCDDICNGKIPDELKPLFRARYRSTFKHVVKRIQLNMPQKTADNFDAQKLKPVIDFYDKQDFIIQYNTRTQNAVEALHQTGARFQLLFDASGGKSQLPKSWQKPVYPIFHQQGYAGGLKPENVDTELDKIAKVAGAFPTWIDAEGGLQKPTGELKPDGTPIKLFDTARAATYIKNVLEWEQKHR